MAKKPKLPNNFKAVPSILLATSWVQFDAALSVVSTPASVAGGSWFGQVDPLTGAYFRPNVDVKWKAIEGSTDAATVTIKGKISKAQYAWLSKFSELMAEQYFAIEVALPDLAGLVKWIDGSYITKVHLLTKSIKKTSYTFTGTGVPASSNGVYGRSFAALLSTGSPHFGDVLESFPQALGNVWGAM